MKESCLIVEPLLAAYALDALEIDEKRQVEIHIETCAECRFALVDYQAVSEGLMAALPPIQPPARVRARLLAQTTPKNQKTGWLEHLRTFYPKLMPVVAFSSILVLLILNLSLMRSTNQVLQNQETLAEQNQIYQTSFAMLTYPDSQTVVIDDGEIYGTLIYDPDGQVAVLNVWGLEPLPEGQDYQIWLIEPDQTRISGGVFQSSGEIKYISFLIESPSSLDKFTAMGVTIEPEGGSPGPTGPRVFGFEL